MGKTKQVNLSVQNCCESETLERKADFKDDVDALIEDLQAMAEGFYEIDKSSVKIRKTDEGFDTEFRVVFSGEYLVLDEPDWVEEIVENPDRFEELFGVEKDV
jgi:hypothetical protein